MTDSFNENYHVILLYQFSGLLKYFILKRIQIILEKI
jgi:hypothetical protein